MNFSTKVNNIVVEFVGGCPSWENLCKLIKGEDVDLAGLAC